MRYALQHECSVALELAVVSELAPCRRRSLGVQLPRLFIVTSPSKSRSLPQRVGGAGGRREAVGGMRKAGSAEQTAVGGGWKADGGRREVEGGRQESESGRWKAEGGQWMAGGGG